MVGDSLPKDKSDMIGWEKGGDDRPLTLGVFPRLSNRFASAMRDLGVERGDRVMVTLGKVPEWHATLLGLLKLGAIAIPSSPMLRANDLKFRTEHSGANTLVGGPESVEEVERIRDEIPNLEHLVLLGEEREGWHSY